MTVHFLHEILQSLNYLVHFPSGFLSNCGLVINYQSNIADPQTMHWQNRSVLKIDFKMAKGKTQEGQVC